MNKKKVYRIMKEHSLLRKAKRKSNRKKPRPAKKNQWRGIDMTKFMVQNVGWVYFVVVLDWRTKKIIGFNVSTDRKSSINLMSDNGSQPTSAAFMEDCANSGINQAFTSYHNPKERVIRTLKEECIRLNEWETFGEVIEGIFKGVKEDNADHLHSALDYLSPNEFEKKLEKENSLENAA